jgi:hypothetical protein
MTSLDKHPSSGRTKLLLIGDSGSGKTGALAALANAGYNLRIQDYDAGCDVLRHFVKKQFHKNVEIVTLVDRIKGHKGRAKPKGIPEAAERGLDLLDKWKYKDPVTSKTIDFGSIYDWGPKEVIVIDSLTMMGEAAFRRHLAVNGRTNENKRQSDWGAAQDIQEGMLQILWSDYVKCNVICTAHIKFIPEDDEVEGSPTHGYPSALGKALPPKVPRYFNSMLKVTTRGSGKSVKRFIRTTSEGATQLKNPAPTIVPAELDLEDGLAKFFELVQKSATK